MDARHEFSLMIKALGCCFISFYTFSVWVMIVVHARSLHFGAHPKLKQSIGRY